MQKPLVLTAALLALASAAQADLKVVQTTKIGNPQLEAMEETMTPQQKAQMAHSDNPLFRSGPQLMTIYVQGSKTRADIGNTTYLMNMSTHQATVLNRRSHTFATRPYTTPGAMGQTTATVKDTGQTKVISGHPARHYTMTMTSASLPGTIIQGDIWAAQDLPQPPMMSIGGGPFAAIQSQFRKVKGFPLKTSIIVTGSPMGTRRFSPRSSPSRKLLCPGRSSPFPPVIKDPARRQVRACKKKLSLARRARLFSYRRTSTIALTPTPLMR